MVLADERFVSVTRHLRDFEALLLQGSCDRDARRAYWGKCHVTLGFDLTDGMPSKQRSLCGDSSLILGSLT